MELFKRPRMNVRISNELYNDLHECSLRVEEWLSDRKSNENDDSDVRYSIDSSLRTIEIEETKAAERVNLEKTEEAKPVSIEKAIEEIKEEIKVVEKEPSFKDVLTRFIDERHLRDPQVYKKAQVDRRTFSKIINQTYGYTKKEIVIRLGLALELGMDDFEKLLRSNGDSFSDLSFEDTVIKYCIRHKIYDVDIVNDILYSLKFKLI